MNTNLEEMYKGVFAEYENVTAAKGCNQYKHVPGCDEASVKTENDNTSFEKKIRFPAQCEMQAHW